MTPTAITSRSSIIGMPDDDATALAPGGDEKTTAAVMAAEAPAPQAYEYVPRLESCRGTPSRRRVTPDRGLMCAARVRGCGQQPARQ